MDLPELPLHNLQLRVGSVIIMLRNLNQTKLCNVTRLAVTKIMKNLIEATVIPRDSARKWIWTWEHSRRQVRKFNGEGVFISRILLMPTNFAFEFKCVQFTASLTFAMPINKSQGQSIEFFGINVGLLCLSHAACSRVSKSSALFVFSSYVKTKNIVHYEGLQYNIYVWSDFFILIVILFLNERLSIFSLGTPPVRSRVGQLV